MSLTLDHAPFAWSALEDATERFADLGLDPEYGGTHADGTTEMAIVGFDDGSYLELIAAVDSDREPGRWPAHVTDDAGPSAWCVEVPEVGREVKRLVDAGVPISGPRTGGRERPDGTLVEWDSAFVGGSDDDHLFPFCIADRTPREYRVTPTESVAGGPLAGVAEVVVATPDLDAAIERYQRAYRLPTPTRTEQPGFGATLARFPGQPLTLAEPLGDPGWSGDDDGPGAWLAERLDRYGAGPCSYLLATDDLGEAGDEHPLTVPEAWGGTRVGWFDADWVGRRLGVVERESGR